MQRKAMERSEEIIHGDCRVVITVMRQTMGCEAGLVCEVKGRTFEFSEDGKFDHETILLWSTMTTLLSVAAIRTKQIVKDMMDDQEIVDEN